jgi:uncharacterized iron-regulated membrane protein
VAVARRWLILVHRYLGIALCPLFTVWFVSGIAMVFARGMPGLNAATRLERMPPLNAKAIRLRPSEASRLAGIGNHPERFLLTTVLDRPAYRVGTEPVTIFADTGERLQQVGESEALAVARRFLDAGGTGVRYAQFVTVPDQWTLTQRRDLPLHKVVADDSLRTEMYVSPRLGEVVVLTTRRSRALAWISAIPHWLYFAPLRVNDLLWRQLILWVSGLATLSVFLGLVLAIAQRSVRYQGWLRWHYWAGAVFGVFALTWAFSGLLSMEPWFWARAAPGAGSEQVAAALAGGPLDLSAFEMDELRWSHVLGDGAVKEVEFLRIQGEPHFAVRSSASRIAVLSAGVRVEERSPFPVESLVARVRNASAETAIADTRMIHQYDAYYYSSTALPLPVLRVKFDDDDRTWLYIDPVTSRVVARFTSRERLQRWLYNGLHSLDFPFLYRRRPLWDVVIVALCVGGTFLSFVGSVIAVRRVRQDFLR